MAVLRFAQVNTVPVTPAPNVMYLVNAGAGELRILVSSNTGTLKEVFGKSAYQVAMDEGFVGTEAEWLTSLDGVDGLSAYEIAVAGGFVGTEAQWLASLEGTPGTNGTNGWTEVLAVITDGERRVLQVVDYVGGTGTKPTAGKYIGVAGLVDLIADGVNVRGAAGANAPAWTYAWQVNDLAVSSVTLVSTDLVMTLEAGKRYEVEFFGVASTTNSTFAFGFGLTFTNPPTTAVGQIVSTAGASASICSYITDPAVETSTTATSGPLAFAKAACIGRFFVESNLATVGTFRFRSELTGSGTQTLYGGNKSYIRYKEMV